MKFLIGLGSGIAIMSGMVAVFLVSGTWVTSTLGPRKLELSWIEVVAHLDDSLVS
jgi:hypothetical protein